MLTNYVFFLFKFIRHLSKFEQELLVYIHQFINSKIVLVKNVDSKQVETNIIDKILDVFFDSVVFDEFIIIMCFDIRFFQQRKSDRILIFIKREIKNIEINLHDFFVNLV